MAAADQWKFVLGLAAGLLAACGILDNQKPPKKQETTSNASARPQIANKAPITPPSELQCDNGTSLTYENFGEAFMLNYCSHCHSQYLTTPAERLGAPLDLNFDSPHGVINGRSRILAVAAAEESNSMPPAAEVPIAERLRLQEWLRCGAPGGDDQIHQD